MQLSELAINKLNRSAPELTKLIVGFKDLSDEVSDDKGVQVGVFILRNGGSQFYIPVLAKGGTVFPIESVFFAEEKCFLPITKATTEQIVNSNSSRIGNSAVRPATAITNPDLQDLIVPPKTGKFVYASSSRLEEFLAILPDHLKSRLAHALEDEDINVRARDLMEIRRIISLLKTRNKIEQEITAEIPMVLTDGEGLSEEAIQDILQKGYHVQNPPQTLRVAVESAGSDSFTTLSGLEQGKAYGLVTKTGNIVPVAVLPRPAAEDMSTEEKQSYKHYRNYELLLLQEGGRITDANRGFRPVAVQQERDYNSILESVPSYPLDQILSVEGLQGDARFIVCTPRGYMGPFRLSDVREENGWITFGNVMAHPSVSAAGYLNDGKWLINSGCTFLPVMLDSCCCDDRFERDINVAQMRHEMAMTAALKDYMDISHDSGTYAIDRTIIGGKPQMIEELVIKRQLRVEDAEDLMKSAEEKRRTRVFMTKLASTGRPGSVSSSTVRTPIVEYGAKLNPDESGTGDSKDRARAQNLKGSLSDATGTGDKSVVEATIMSELLQDQDMIGTVGEYLDDIKSSVDKLGRILLLTRLHSAKLSEEYDSEGLSNLITSVKNTFRSLGENYLKLEQMTRNV